MNWNDFFTLFCDIGKQGIFSNLDSQSHFTSVLDPTIASTSLILPFPSFCFGIVNNYIICKIFLYGVEWSYPFLMLPSQKTGGSDTTMTRHTLAVSSNVESIRRVSSEFKMRLPSDHLGARDCPSRSVTLSLGKECLCLTWLMFNVVQCVCRLLCRVISVQMIQKSWRTEIRGFVTCLKDRHMTRLPTRLSN